MAIAGSLPQCCGIEVALDDTKENFLITTHWSTMTVEGKKYTNYQTTLSVETYLAGEYGVQSEVKSHYDVARTQFTAASITLPAEPTGILRYGFDEEA